jgi:P-type Cu+ transporter
VNNDPVCGAPVDPLTTIYTSEFQGQTYYFCSAACKEQFDMNPTAYAFRAA